jgi:SpoVK/Ycf46/Vps4 family AAA+-type ATPase
MASGQVLLDLELVAAQHAQAAIGYERQGDVSSAISSYEQSVDILKKLVALYPDCPQTTVYREYLTQYASRAQALKTPTAPQIHIIQEPPGSSVNTNLLQEKPAVKWDDVIGLQNAKQAIQDAIIYPMKRPDFFPLGWPRGILFFGPPGCGKTLLAAATAAEIDAAFYCIDASTIMSKWLGESEKNVHHVFETARQIVQTGQPAIIFIDELDSLIGVRSEEVGGEVRMRKQFMMEMDGISDKRQRLRVYVIGATNKPWDLDEPFLRRFQKRIYVPLPDHEARLKILSHYSASFHVTSGIDFHTLALMTEGYSGSDLFDVVQGVHLGIVREFFTSQRLDAEAASLRPITMHDFLDVLAIRQPSVSLDGIRHYKHWYQRYKAL